MFVQYLQLGSVVLENLQQMTNYQFDLARTYTQFAAGQWQDTMELVEPERLEKYFEKQNKAVQELTRKVTESASRVMQSNEQTARRSLEMIQGGAEVATSMMQRGAEATQSAVEQTARQVQEQKRQGERQQSRQSGTASNATIF